MKFRIIFDGLPGPEGGRFVEVENDQGKSINAGEWSVEGRFYVLTIDAQSGDALKIARINAATVAATAEIEGMKAVNAQYALGGDPPPRDEADFEKVAKALRNEIREILRS